METNSRNKKDHFVVCRSRAKTNKKMRHSPNPSGRSVVLGVDGLEACPPGGCVWPGWCWASRLSAVSPGWRGRSRSGRSAGARTGRGCPEGGPSSNRSTRERNAASPWERGELQSDTLAALKTQSLFMGAKLSARVNPCSKAHAFTTRSKRVLPKLSFIFFLNVAKFSCCS